MGPKVLISPRHIFVSEAEKSVDSRTIVDDVKLLTPARSARVGVEPTGVTAAAPNFGIQKVPP